MNKKLLPSGDYTFCESRICKISNKCIRHRKHYDFKSDIIYSRFVDERDSCDNFWEIEYITQDEENQNYLDMLVETFKL
jgi:hypothetical protein